MHPIVALAREAVEACVKRHRKIQVPKDLPPGFEKPAAVFVCLKKGKALRGCIGTLSPTCSSAAAEVIQNAVSACTRDSRFQEVAGDELADLTYTVDVLEAAEPVTDLSQLDPRVYGVIVRKGHRRGLLLPDLDEVDTVQEQLAIARSKASIGQEETGVEISRFRVTRYT